MRIMLFLCLGLLLMLTSGNCEGPIIGPDLYPPTFSLKLIDKSTGKSLIFGKNAKYSIAQIQIVQLFQGKRYSIQPGPNDSLKEIIIVPNAGIGPDTTYISLPNLSQDTILSTESLVLNHGGQLMPGSLTLNKILLCKPCDNFIITIAK